MTSATDELRAKLTEHGIEYTTNDYMGLCETSWNGFTAMQLTPTAKLTMVLTPEQAIAATLGSGTLTVEQVRKVLLLHLPHREYYSVEQTDVWQEIADELNANLGGGTCEQVLTKRITELKANDGTRWYELFGTPERAARTLSEHDTSCRDCLLGAYCGEECLTEEEPKLLEWLRGPV